MKKEWKKNKVGQYSFFIDNTEIGQLEFNYKNFKKVATITMENKSYTINLVGFWGSSIEIKDQEGAIILKTYNEKWYANSSIIEYGSVKYKLIVRNNPLAEYAIIDNNETILAYGLKFQNGKASLGITESKNDINTILHFLLWYLFLPIATENCGDNFAFFMLLLG